LVPTPAMLLDRCTAASAIPLMWRALQWCLLFSVVEETAAAGVKGKTPVVKWGQRPDRLYLVIPLADVVEPEVTMEERRVSFKGISRGEEYEVDMKLLRGINVTESKHKINKWNLQFDLKKLRKEPCWKRLLRSKKTHSWLKKDQDRWYTEECQFAKETWREAYFTAKLNGENPNKGAAAKKEEEKAAEAVARPPDNLEIKQEKDKWQKMIKEFRDKAVPRTKAAPKKKAKKPDQDEL